MQVFGGDRAVKQMGLDAAPSARHEYSTNALTLELVRDMDEAITHIHSFGSSHTEAIITGVCAYVLLSLSCKGPPDMFHSCSAEPHRCICHAQPYRTRCEKAQGLAHRLEKGNKQARMSQ